MLEKIQPYDLVIAHSEMTNQEASQLRQKLYLEFNPNFNITIANDEKKHHAAGNRNRGVKFCTGDYISFIDADDTSNSNRIHKISNIINKYQPICIVHSFLNPNRTDVFKYLFDVVKPNRRTLFMGNEIYYYAFLNKRTKSESAIRLKNTMVKYIMVIQL